MRYNYYNIPIKINNNLFIVNNANLSLNTDVNPDYQIHDFFTNKFKNNNNYINISLDLSYFLQSNDPLLKKITNDDLITCEFGNIILNSGVLQSLNLSSNPNENINVQANINFWSNPLNNFEQNILPRSGFNEFLNSSQITINNLAGNWTSDKAIYSFNYQYESQANPRFDIKSSFPDNINPDLIIINTKQARLEIDTDWWNSNYSLTGEYVSAKINFWNKNLTNNDALIINGVINARNINIISKKLAQNKITITQNNFNLNPSFSIISPMYPNAGDYVFIDLNNFNTVQYVKLNDEYLDFNVTKSNYIQFKLPDHGFSGILAVQTYGGLITTGLKVHSKPIIIDSINPNFGYSGQNIILKGSNFYDISSVTFGSVSATDFEVISPNTIYVSVPNNASYNFINVNSTKRSRTAQSSEHFASFPIIDNFLPVYGNYGDTIDIYGKNFNSVEDVKFNNNSATTFSIITDNHITAEVPSNVNIYGYIQLTGHNGVVSYTTYPFKPKVEILNSSPEPVSEGATLTLTIANGEPQYLYQYGEQGQYAVYFQEKKLGKFNLIDSTTLQGLVPDDFVKGKIFIVEPDGASLYTGGLFVNKNPVNPAITSINNPKAYINIPFYTSIVGTDLENISGIWFNPVNTINPTPEKIILSSTDSYVHKNPDGSSIDIVNYIFNDNNLRGSYDLYVVATGNLSAPAPVKYRIFVSGGS